MKQVIEIGKKLTIIISLVCVSYRDIGKIFWRLVILGTILLALIFVISQVFFNCTGEI